VVYCSGDNDVKMKKKKVTEINKFDF
jgi:hypothetical protein